MNKRILIYFFLFIFCQANGQSVSKPMLDTSALRTRWGFAPGDHIELSNDGKYVVYTVDTSSQKDKILFIRSTVNNWQRIFRGQEVSNVYLTEDSKKALFKGNKDSLFLVTLGTDQIEYIGHVESFSLIKNLSGEWLVRSPKTGEYLIRKMGSDVKWELKNVLDYSFNEQGNAILINASEQNGGIRISILSVLDLQTGSVIPVYKGTGQFGAHGFDHSGNQIVFSVREVSADNHHSSSSIWYFKRGETSARILADNQRLSGFPGLTAGGWHCQFSSSGKRVFFTMNDMPSPKAPDNAVKVDVWNYQDNVLQFDQLREVSDNRPQEVEAVIDIQTGDIFRLQEANENILSDYNKENGILSWLNRSGEGWWNPKGRSTLYWTSAIDGSRTVIKDSIAFRLYAGVYNTSPDGHWVLYFDRENKAWYSFDTRDYLYRNISKAIPYPVYSDFSAQYPENISLQAAGIAGWRKNDRAVFICDDYDIWEVDPSGTKRPINITGGYGRRHHIKFRIAPDREYKNRIIGDGDTLLLHALNTQTKYNGFFQKIIGDESDPQKLIMQPAVLYVDDSQIDNGASIVYSCMLRKAQNANVWVMTRRSVNEAPNYFITRDFKTLTPLTDVQPQKKYNWITSELINCKLPDGKYTQAAVYKPENFDPKKKYPVIFSYYEQLSSDVYDYLEISYTYAKLNIPYFVSRGYIVCTPDIHYRIGHPGQSALEAVEAAAKYLSAKPWIDSKHMGLQGHSFGGTETNYIITHSHLFAAAEEGAGVSDNISAYGRGHDGIAGNWYLETGQGRIGANLWDHQELYLENSPVLKADKITTPLLIMHNKEDGQVAFGQGVEMFTALRRLGKRVWMLQYDGCGHAIGEDAAALDHTVRLEQFFDHYLKGVPPPKWMTEGIPAKRKGLDTGYELDLSGKEPQEQPVLFNGKIQKVSEKNNKK